jgi:hypothetical protein
MKQQDLPSPFEDRQLTKAELVARQAGMLDATEGDDSCFSVPGHRLWAMIGPECEEPDITVFDDYVDGFTEEAPESLKMLTCWALLMLAEHHRQMLVQGPASHRHE